MGFSNRQLLRYIGNYNLHINNFKLFFTLFLIVFLILEIIALGKDSHYIYDIPMCALLLYIVYRYRSLLHLDIVLFILFSIFLLVHCLGLFDAYLLYPLGIEYDYWVHGYFGLVSGLIIFKWMNLYLKNTHINAVLIFTLLFVLGISALHELYEYAGALLLGSGEGVLFIGAGDLDQWDTQKDMLNNVIGAVVGVSLRIISS